VEQSYLDATVGAVSVAEWQEVVEKALEQAKAGDAKAREWLSKMLVGSDPIPLGKLVEELQAELGKLRHGKHTSREGKAALGGGAVANGAGGPAVGVPVPRADRDLHGGGDESGPLAGGTDVLPLFAADDAGVAADG
jgi:hypothetical protein